MAPPPPPGLMDDVIGEILVRLPPTDPACLVRATLVCKRWRSLVLDDDGAFLRHYRAFHRTAPVLGFFNDEQCGYDDDIFVPRFVPTTTTTTGTAMRALQPLPQPAASAGPRSAAANAKTYSCRTLDCRHGRVLFDTSILLEPSTTLTVWDPVTGDHHSFSPPSDIDPYYEFTGAVLCASASASAGVGGGGCDHLDCSARGRPFLVVIAGVSIGENFDEDGVAWARVYSSETAAWGAPITLDDVDSFVDPAQPSLLAAGAVYFMLGYGRKILKYDLAGGAGALSVMKAPPQQHEEAEPNMIFAAAARDDELGAVTVEGYSLHLWSWDDGVGEWARVRVIHLDPAIVPTISSIGDGDDPSTTKFDLAGSATVQGAGLIYISANDDQQSIFTVQLKSGRITKTGNTRNYGYIFPFMSFFDLHSSAAGGTKLVAT